MEWKVLKNLSYTNSKVADTLQQESSRTMAALLISISVKVCLFGIIMYIAPVMEI